MRSLTATPFAFEVASDLAPLPDSNLRVFHTPLVRSYLARAAWRHRRLVVVNEG